MDEAKKYYFTNKSELDSIAKEFLGQNSIVFCSRRVNFNSKSYWIGKSYKPTIDTLIFIEDNNHELENFKQLIKNSSDSLKTANNDFLIEVAQFLQKYNVFEISVPFNSNYVEIRITKKEGIIYSPTKLDLDRKDMHLEKIDINWYFFKDNSVFI